MLPLVLPCLPHTLHGVCRAMKGTMVARQSSTSSSHTRTTTPQKKKRLERGAEAGSSSLLARAVTVRSLLLPASPPSGL